MVASAVVEASEASTELSPQLTESKHALACDAISKVKVHAVDSTNSYLTTLLSVFDQFVVNSERGGLFDVKVLAAIDRSAHYINEYREFLEVLSPLETIDEYEPALIDFLESVLACKKRRNGQHNHAYLWHDSLRFIAREIFLSTVAALLKHRQWNTVRNLLDHQYHIEGAGRFSFANFDGFFRSVDTFHNRRLNLQRISVSADILKERVEAGSLPFDEVIQADFVLHLSSLLRAGSPLAPWTARTLSYAEEASLSGFDIFIAARGEENNACLQVLFDVPTWAELMAKVRTIIGPEIESDGQDPDIVDYSGFLAQKNGIFNR